MLCGLTNSNVRNSVPTLFGVLILVDTFTGVHQCQRSHHRCQGVMSHFKGDLPRKLQGCLFHFNLEVEVEVGVIWCHTIVSQRKVRPADKMCITTTVYSVDGQIDLNSINSFAM